MFSIWTNSYIRYEGKKIFLETSYETLKKKMKSSAKEIELTVSGVVFGKNRMFKKDKISDYGEAGLV